MTRSIIDLGPIVTILGAFAFGIYALRFGWLILFKRQAPLSILDRIALSLLKVTSGASIAQKREDEFKTPERRRFEGFMALVVGGILVVVGIWEFVLIVIGSISIIRPTP